MTELVIVYETKEGTAVVHPAPEFVAALMRGGVVRNTRWVGDIDGKPVLEGGGELLPAMTEQEAVEFVAWKDVPVEVQQAHARGNRPLVVICRRAQLPERTFRNAWRLADVA